MWHPYAYVHRSSRRPTYAISKGCSLAIPPPIASEKSTQGSQGITATLVTSGDLVRFCQIRMRLPLKIVIFFGGTSVSETSGYDHVMKSRSGVFLYRGDRQMTEIFVSGTEVFSDAKMTETPYE